MHLSDIVAKGDLQSTQVEGLNEYHADPKKDILYKNIRKSCTNIIYTILDNCPECDDRVQAIQLVRRVRMMANSAIALEGVE
jgi:hypothetical protein